MMFNTLLPGFVSGLVFSNFALAAPAPDPVAQVSTPTPSCVHSETNRQCWKDGFDINTDYDVSTPAGEPRKYLLIVRNVTSFGPDGVSKPAMLINGTFPGPTIVANWGDTLEITVRNEMPDNGTAIHWHGIRQLNTALHDGANGVTECPIAPFKSRTYRFRATQYGTSWYHSHFSAQYGNGVVGAIHINGPASANYDIDLGTYPISDWYWDTADNIMRFSEIATNLPPPSDNVLFNGTNIDYRANGTREGKYNRVTLTPNKKHRLRLINTSVENHFVVTLSGHNFTVIQTDFVPVKPVVKNSLFMAIGQRYDIIIDTTGHESKHYWFNATQAAGSLCGLSDNPSPAAIFSYADAPEPATGIPKEPGTVPPPANCADETGWEPIVKRTAPKDQFLANQKPLDVRLGTPEINGTRLFRWTINNVSIDVAWEKPTLRYVQERNTSYPTNASVIVVDEAHQWTFWVIQNNLGLPHPFHLHGHDFLHLGTGTGIFTPTPEVIDRLQFDNPIRRDVAMLPGSGWIVIAFLTDNPGAWLLHCHIAWHVSQGLSVQFLEQRARIPEVMDLTELDPTCTEWNAYWPTAYWPKTDSGL